MASFCTKLLQDYYDYTMNTTFLRHHAYPLTKLNGEFYLSYMTRKDGKYNVMHGCGMEGCNAQGANESGNMTFSNNPPPDLAFAKRSFRYYHTRFDDRLHESCLCCASILSRFPTQGMISLLYDAATSSGTRKSLVSTRSSGLRGRMC